MQQLEYDKEITSRGILELDSLGNCFVSAYNDKGEVWRLKIKTVMGTTEFVQYGPIFEGNGEQEIEEEYSCTYSKAPFNEKGIKSYLDKFLNDRTRKITQAFEITEKDFISSYLDFKEVING